MARTAIANPRPVWTERQAPGETGPRNTLSFVDDLRDMDEREPLISVAIGDMVLCPIDGKWHVMRVFQIHDDAIQPNDATHNFIPIKYFWRPTPDDIARHLAAIRQERTDLAAMLNQGEKIIHFLTTGQIAADRDDD